MNTPEYEIVEDWFLDSRVIRMHETEVKVIHYLQKGYRFYKGYVSGVLITQGQRKFSAHLRAIEKELTKGKTCLKS